MISVLSDQDVKKLLQLKKSCFKALGAPADTDRIEAASGLVHVYEALPSTYSPRILFSDGPRSAGNILCHLLGVDACKGQANIDGIPFGMYRNARNISDEIFLAHVTEANRIKQKFNRSFTADVAASLRNMVLYDLNYRIAAQVVQPVMQSLDASKPPYLSGFRFRPSLYPSSMDTDWIRFYNFCDTCFGLNLTKDLAAQEFIDAGGCMAYTYDSFGLIVPGPESIHVDEMGRLHSEDGPAVHWTDGTRIYFWNGVEVPEVLLENPDEVTREEILNEKNAEVRRCYLEVLGSEKFGSLLGLQLLDHSKDRFGNDLKLFRTKDRDQLAGDYIYFGAVVCPSTLRSYFLCVPPHVKTAKEAVSWTFGKTPEAYNPDIET